MFTVAAAFGNVHGVYKVGNQSAAPSFAPPDQCFRHLTRCLIYTPPPRPFQPGNVKLSPEILRNGQNFVQEKLSTSDPKVSVSCLYFCRAEKLQSPGD